jgi:hypothetical protein
VLSAALLFIVLRCLYGWSDNGGLGRGRGVDRHLGVGLRIGRDVAVGIGVAVEQFNASNDYTWQNITPFSLIPRESPSERAACFPPDRK